MPRCAKNKKEKIADRERAWLMTDRDYLSTLIRFSRDQCKKPPKKYEMWYQLLDQYHFCKTNAVL
jgi:hypothetical protein